MVDVISEISYLGLHLYHDAVVGNVLAGDASVTSVDPAAIAAITANGGSVPTPAAVSTLSGGSIPGIIGGLTAHTWVADANGEYHTSTNLATEWQGYYQQMLAGHADSLTAVQRMEGNAEAVFENTGLAQLKPAIQERDREDLQREFDAIGAALVINQAVYGTNPNAQLTAQTYLQLEQTIQSSPVLEELAIQGHGLNKPPASKYDGYTNDIQNKVDGVTLYVGGGLDTGETAVANLLDDVIITHVPFSTVWQNGHYEQLNQNGAAEDTLANSVTAFDNAAYDQVFVSSDFSANPHAVGAVVAVPGAVVGSGASGATLTPSATTTLYGTPELATLTNINGHTWTADANGLYQTTTNLAAEWEADYQQMLSGNGASLTVWQRLEGNAEAVFENTGLSHLSAAKLVADREDVQRSIDAEAYAMQIAIAEGVLPASVETSTQLTDASFVQLQHILQGSPVLEELAVQGHGLNNPPEAKYRGFTNDFQNNVDKITDFIGGGLGSGANALANLFDDSIMNHMAFPTVEINGVQTQLNQNGNKEDTLDATVSAVDALMYQRVLVAPDFSANPNATGPVVTLSTAEQFWDAWLALTRPNVPSTVGAKPLVHA